MSRPNKGRTIRAEANLALRMAYERDRRDWTYDGLARRMADAGCPIQATALYKIEKGSPPRRVTVDELAALAHVFDVDPSEMLRPMAEIGDRAARELLGRLNEASDRIVAANADLGAVLQDLTKLAFSSPTVARQVVELARQGAAGGVVLGTYAQPFVDAWMKDNAWLGESAQEEGDGERR